MKSDCVNLIIAVLIFYLGSLPAGATGINYDTAWTFVYDGGKYSEGGSMY